MMTGVAIMCLLNDLILNLLFIFFLMLFYNILKTRVKQKEWKFPIHFV